MSALRATARLSPADARDLTEEVKADAAALWAKLLTLYEGEAHLALKYSSWGKYYAEEFGESKSRGYQLLEAARVDRALGESKILERPATDHVARELSPVLRDEPERVEEVWGEVVDLHGPTPTAKEVRAVVTRANGTPTRRPCEGPADKGKPLTRRQAALADAARDRLGIVLSTIDGMCDGLAKADFDRATTTATPEAIKSWIQTVERAAEQLSAVASALKRTT